MRYGIIAALLSLLGHVAFAGDTVSLPVTVDLQDTAQLAVIGTKPVLALDDPVTGGQPVAAVTDGLTKLQYTSVVATGEARTIQAALLGAQPPAGTTLKITATPPTGGGSVGDCGDSTGQKTLGPTAVPIITGIGGCCTGVGAGDGATITYELSVGTISQLVVSPPDDLVVTFTITEAQ